MKFLNNIFLPVLAAAMTLSMAGCEGDTTVLPEPPPVYTPSEITPRVMGTTISVKWRGSLSATGYLLQISSDAAFTAPVELTTVQPTGTFEELLQYTVYYLRVMSLVEGEPASEWSAVKEAETGGENILHAELVDVTDTSITVGWKPGSKATHLTWIVDGAEGEPQTVELADEDIQAGVKEIAGLANETTYDVKIFDGGNQRGEGVYSTLPRGMARLAVEATPYPDSVLLKWEAGAEATFFTWAKTGTTSRATVELTDDEIIAGAYKIEGLEPATDYTVEFFWTSPVTGTDSSLGETAFRTAELPALTLEVAEATILDNGATVSWTPADDLHVTTLAFSPADVEPIAVTPADAAGVAVTGLKPGVEYTVTLNYLSSAGTEYLRGEATFTTTSAVPAATVSVAGDPTRTGATIVWSPSDEADSSLVFTDASGAEITFDVTNADASGINCDGLTAGTEYTVTLLAVIGDITYTRGTTTVKTQDPLGGKEVTKTWDFSAPAWDALHAAVMAKGNDGFPDMNETIEGLNIFTTASNIRAGGEVPDRYFQPNGGGRIPDRRLFSFTAPSSGTLSVTTSNTGGTADDTRMVVVQVGDDAATEQRKAGATGGLTAVTNNFDLNVTAGQTVYIYPSNGLRFYKIEYTYVEAAPSYENKFWNVTDIPEDATTDIVFSSNGAILQDLNILATSANTVTIDDNKKEIDDYTFTKRIKLNGTYDKALPPTYRVVKFAVQAACKITVYGMSGSGGAVRNLVITDGTRILNDNFLSNDGNAIGKATYEYTGGAGDIYIGSAGSGYNIYAIGVEYAAAPAPEDKVWNVTDYPDAVASFVAPAVILGDLTVLAAEGKNVDIDENSKSIDDFSFTKRIKLGGNSDSDGTTVPTNRAIQFDVEAACKIIVYGMSSSNGTSRTLRISDGTQVLSEGFTNDGSVIGKIEYPYTGGAGKIYLSSTSGGFNIYGIVVDYP